MLLKGNMNLVRAVCQVCIMSKVFGVYSKSFATFFVCQLLTLINASFFGLYEMECIFKARIKPHVVNGSHDK